MTALTPPFPLKTKHRLPGLPLPTQVTPPAENTEAPNSPSASNLRSQEHATVSIFFSFWFWLHTGPGEPSGRSGSCSEDPSGLCLIAFSSWLPHDAHNMMLCAGPGPENKAGPVLPRRRGWEVGWRGSQAAHAHSPPAGPFPEMLRRVSYSC